jgi:hypothetical protein
MKKNLLKLTLCLGLLAMVGCGGGNGETLSSDVELNILDNKEEVKKIYDEIVKKLGDQITKVDEINIYIDNPDEKTIKKAGAKPTMSLRLDVLSPSNPKKIQRTNYWSEYNGWQAPETMEVELRGVVSKKDKEDFNLASTMWDFKEKVSFETFSKVIAESIAKNNQNPEKYTYRYIHNVDITENGYSISIHAKLASNDQKVDEYYKFSLDGKLKK